MVQNYFFKVMKEIKQTFWDGSGSEEKVWDNFSYKMVCEGSSDRRFLNID